MAGRALPRPHRRHRQDRPQYPLGVERIGLVGLPNSGKSSLFNALTGGSALVASHPFSTTETSVGVAQVPDHRLDALAAMSSSRKVVHATVEFVDIAGLVAGSSTGEGLGNRFLGGIREADALCLVLRAFEDPNVPGGSDPLEDLGVLELELVLADLATAETQIERRRKAAQRTSPSRARWSPWRRLSAVWPTGLPFTGRAWQRGPGTAAAVLHADQQAGAGRGQPGRGHAGDDASLHQARRGRAGERGEVLGVSVKLEAEAAQLAEEDRAELLEGLGLGEGALPRVAQAAYRLLGRRTFFTTGDKESRAWTFRAGAKAPECAGVIHSDLQRGFIRAEVVHWDELLRSAPGPPPRTSASCGSRARTTRSSTAMSSRSVSTSEPRRSSRPRRHGPRRRRWRPGRCRGHAHRQPGGPFAPGRRGPGRRRTSSTARTPAGP